MRGDNPKIQQCAGKRVPVGECLSKQAALNCAFGMSPVCLRLYKPSLAVTFSWVPGRQNKLALEVKR